MAMILEQFARDLDPGVHTVMIWDQAGFHCSKDLKVPDNVSIVPLPPYSPELNPIENLWHYLRSHHWANRVYESYDDLRQAACEAWQESCLDAELIKTVCNAPYITQRKVQS